MNSFMSYCYEANANGSKFEKLVTNNVQKWIDLKNLSNRFKAERYQTVSEDNSNREEDYSDIIVRDLQNKSEFFIECKQTIRDNVLNIQFDILDDCSLVPVKKADRIPSKSANLNRLAHDIENTSEWKKFKKFMMSRIGKHIPLDVWLGKDNVNDNELNVEINKYNSLVKSGNTLDNSKEFNINNIRKSTINQLYVALQWRTRAHSSTWDIIHLKNISYFGKMIADHYMYGKAGEIKYIQIGTNCYRFSDDPLNTTCKKFPIDTLGQFDLKFTPRFGVGGMYLTPRSKITQMKLSNFTFKK